MKILLLANQPERTTRLRMFRGTLQSQGHEVIVPSFGTRNWISIARQAKRMALDHKPDEHNPIKIVLFLNEQFLRYAKQRR